MCPEVALKISLSGSELAYLKVEVSIEHSWTVLAFESLYSPVHFYVFVKVGPLCEGKLTSRLRAFVGSFVSVDPKMVKEVVPLPEVLGAARVFAFQNFNEPFRPRVFKCEYLELLCGWDVLLDLHRVKVKVLARLNFNTDVSRNFSEGVAIMNVRG
jgi:hypothetical protein